jgi:hypothetical protein
MTTIPAMANELTLSHPHLLDDVVRAGSIYVLLGFDGIVGINEKLVLATVEAVSDENRKADHGWKEGEALASLK